ncbi:MAG TPA: helix-turn-helix domain-containing protein [Euzebyales bacterium]|nr:helix-turn-helix domain-containing protein [Euzebyales bacterium]
MRKRAEQVDETRQRIVEAAAELHTTRGPAKTTVSALAEVAGVTRLTVYRHFPDEDELFAACRHHWIVQHPPPDATAWPEIADLEERARVALGQLYGWYGRHGDALYPIYRDMETMPRSSQDEMRAADAHLVDALLAGSQARGDERRRLRAAAGHVVSYRTWRSLVLEQGLAAHEAVCLAARLLLAAPPACDGSSRPPD